MKPLYLDNAATTRVDKKVVKEMENYFLENFGNPSSLHELGEKAKNAINDARKILCLEINAKPWEIYFTSSGTEANNLAIQGLARASQKKKKIIISEIEHPSVLEPCKFLQSQGFQLIKIPVNHEGLINMQFLKKQLEKNSKEILLVSVMQVNNIIGTLQDIEKIGILCNQFNVLFHTDAVQSFGKLNIDVKKFNISLLSASAHKINGPKGTGFLYISEKIKISPLIFGGGQEKDLRSGTENVPAIIGFAKALELYKKINKNKILKLRSTLITKLEKIGGKINGSKENRIFNNIHVSFPNYQNLESDYLVTFLSQRKIYVSAGSACDSNKEKEDHVLKAIGLNSKEAKSSIRITINENLKEKDVDYVIREIKKALRIFKSP
ncbi:cysteine desulfurase [Candidatus Pacearchaeota archaeon]|nr:cysteine desulfurase [Candidatus Pacearchaeota archaeon]